MAEKECGKVYRIVLGEVMTYADTVTHSTLQSAISATGSYGQYQQYFEEASKILEKASLAGTISPYDIKYMQSALDEMTKISEGYQKTIIDLTKKNDGDRIVAVKAEIDDKILGQQQMISEMYEKTVGPKTWKAILGFFGIERSEKDKTAIFKGMAHKEIVALLAKWVETKDEKKMFSDVIHGLGESGIDITVQVISQSNQKFGIQVKNNDDVKQDNFATTLKAQITESKAHHLIGLILFFAADVTDRSVEMKISSILSSISQWNDPSIVAISPERAVTILNQVL